MTGFEWFVVVALVIIFITLLCKGNSKSIYDDDKPEFAYLKPLTQYEQNFIYTSDHLRTYAESLRRENDALRDRLRDQRDRVIVVDHAALRSVDSEERLDKAYADIKENSYQLGFDEFVSTYDAKRIVKKQLMDEHTKTAIQKLKIIKDLSNSAEVNQVCKVLIEWLGSQEKSEMGFSANSSEKEK